MENNDVRAIQILAAEMQKVARRLINTASYDKTVAGIIVSSVGNGKYKVKIKEEVFTIPSSSDIDFVANDPVWITIPQNNMQNKFIAGRRRA